MVSVDELLNGVDFDQELTLEEFEEIIQPLRERLWNLLVKVETWLNENDHRNIFAVELLGDCSRTNLFNTVIKEKFGAGKLKRTLNSTEFAARGAGQLGQSRYPAPPGYDYYPIIVKNNTKNKINLSLGTDVMEDDVNVIIPTGTVFPYEKRKSYRTTEDN